MKESKSVDIVYSWDIFQESWDYTKGKRFMFLITMIAVAVITLSLSMIPFVGAIFNGLLSSFLGAGFILLVHNYIEKQTFQFDTIFEALSNRELFKKVFPLAIFMAFWQGLFSLVGFVMESGSGGVEEKLYGVGITFIGTMFLSIFTYFATPLIVFDNYSLIAAMSSSAEALAKNIGLFFCYSVLIWLISLVAIIPVGIGLLFLAAPVSCHGYLFYRKIYN